MTEISESSPSFWQIRSNSEQHQSFPAAKLWCYAVLCMPAKKEMILVPNRTLPYISLKCPRGACITRHNTGAKTSWGCSPPPVDSSRARSLSAPRQLVVTDLTGNNGLWRKFYDPVRQNDGQRKSLTQPLVQRQFTQRWEVSELHLNMNQTSGSALYSPHGNIHFPAEFLASLWWSTPAVYLCLNRASCAQDSLPWAVWVHWGDFL